MRLIVLGPPGSERQTIAGLVALRLGVPAISLAGVFKAGVRDNVPAAAQAARHMNAGELVPEQVLFALLRNRLTRSDTTDGFVLDGFPNHWVPAGPLDVILAEHGAPVDRAVDLVLSDVEATRRLSGRRLCRACGRTWHIQFAPPTRPGVCDQCGGELFQRDDDNPSRISVGLASYRSATAPTLDHYRSLGRLLPVDATLPPSEIVAVATGAEAGP